MELGLCLRLMWGGTVFFRYRTVGTAHFAVDLICRSRECELFHHALKFYGTKDLL